MGDLTASLAFLTSVYILGAVFFLGIAQRAEYTQRRRFWFAAGWPWHMTAAFFLTWSKRRKR